MSLVYGEQGRFFSDVDNAEREILKTYGDKVSVTAKDKSLRKFGRHPGVTTSFTTIQEFQGSEANETFVSTNLIDSISSSSASDNGKTFTIEGQTIDGNGNLTFVVQNATLDGSDGRTKVTLTTPLARATRIYVTNSGVFNSPQAVPVGTIYVYDDTGGVTNGVPNTAAATKIVIVAGESQSEKCATSISSQDYWIITEYSAAIARAGGSAAKVQIRMEYRQVDVGGVWRPVGRDIVIDTDQNGVFVSDNPNVIIPKNCDWRMRARTDANTADIQAEARGYLALIV